MRFLSGFSVNLEDGKKTSWVTLTRTGQFADPRYGSFEISKPMLLAMVANFDKRTYGQDIFIDVSHRASDGAAAKVLRLEVQGDRLRALVEWTPYGLDAVRNQGFKYLSAEYVEDYFDPEKKTRNGPLLLGAGLTIRPVIKRLDPIELAEEDGPPTLIHPDLQARFLQETTDMWKKLIEALVASLKAKKLSEAATKEFADQATKALEGVADEAMAKRILAAFESAGVKLAEQSPGDAVSVKIDLTGIAPAQAAKSLSEEDVTRILEERAKKLAEETAATATALAAKKKILTDAIA
ncbi:MAG: phage protease, partial [Burkholderiales bacterium]